MKMTHPHVLISISLISSSALAACMDERELSEAEGAVSTARAVSAAGAGYAAADVVHTFTQPSGDVIDCVRRERQPGLRGASARGVVVAAPPAVSPSGVAAPVVAEGTAGMAGVEAFLVEGQRDAAGAERFCRGGTVPIRRSGSGAEARVRPPGPPALERAPGERTLAAERTGSTAIFQYAVARQLSFYNQGVHAAINVWDPQVEAITENSSSRVEVWRGAQWISAGVQESPVKYRTWLPHLFIYSTSDGGGAAGCYDLDCGRFVQVDGTVVIGGALAPLSASGKAQYEIETSLLLWQGNWWVGINGVWVGYYPGALFDAAGLAYGADNLDFGGVITEDRQAHPGRHTMTDMGSGAFPAAGWQYAAYQRDLRYWTDPAHSYQLTGLTTYRTDSSCYDASLAVTQDPSWRTYLFMGGPGYSASCL